jgi:hypothetical protein
MSDPPRMKGTITFARLKGFRLPPGRMVASAKRVPPTAAPGPEPVAIPSAQPEHQLSAEPDVLAQACDQIRRAQAGSRWRTITVVGPWIGLRIAAGHIPDAPEVHQVCPVRHDRVAKALKRSLQRARDGRRGA